MTDSRLILSIFAVIISSLLFIGSSIWPMSREQQRENTSDFQPPPWVFGVAWGYIWLTLIIVWVYITMTYPQMNIVWGTFIIYTLFFGCSFIWPYVYRQNEVHAYWLLWVMLWLAWWIWGVSCKVSWLLAGFVAVLPVWLAYASTLI